MKINTENKLFQSKETFENYEDLLVDQDEVNYLLIIDKRLKQATLWLNRELARFRNEYTKDRNAAIKDLKAFGEWEKQENKAWEKPEHKENFSDAHNWQCPTLFKFCSI